jgi:LmbE family N-acetylglucosaminyl deacetylase
MSRQGFVAAVVVAVAAALAWRANASDVQPIPIEVNADERLLVVAPHPDDETLGAGGLVQRVLERGGTVRVVLMTAGDGFVEAVVHDTGLPRPRPAQYVSYGERRLREARAAMRALAEHSGEDRLRLQILGFPDGGLEGLLRAHWRRSHPERSATTGASDPPYDGEALEPDVPYDGADLRRELVRVLRETQPTIVVLPDPFDKHPDHRATSLFTLLALDDWLRDASSAHMGRPAPPMPRLLAYLVHWPGWPPGWDASPPPLPATAGLALPRDLPPRGLAQAALTLTDAEVAGKRAALARYASQQEEMASLLAAFVCRSEPYTVLTGRELQRVGHMIERRARGKRPPHRRH